MASSYPSRASSAVTPERHHFENEWNINDPNLNTIATEPPPKRPPGVKSMKRTFSVPSLDLDVHIDASPYVVGLANAWSTSANIVKATMGAAVFAMPYVFREMGAVGGGAVVLLLSLLSFICMLLLVYAKRLVAEDTLEQYISYVDIGRNAYGPVGAACVYFLSVIASLGVAAANVTFVGSTLIDVLATDYSIPHLQPWYFTVGSFVVIAPLTYVRSFSVLAIASYVGNVCLLGGVIGTVMYGYKQEHHFHEVKYFNFGVSSLAKIFVQASTVLYIGDTEIHGHYIFCVLRQFSPVTN
eukprot:m.28146 g.28146  ORF g.28146 m.28146 type:complete len:298 (+) comp7977_c0_seq2:296-1189(+)